MTKTKNHARSKLALTADTLRVLTNDELAIAGVVGGAKVRTNGCHPQTDPVVVN